MLSLVSQCDAIVLSYGEEPSAGVFKLLKSLKLPLIAVDGAIDSLERLNLKATYVVGDMDSLQNKPLLQNYRQEQIELYKSDKEESDTELALKLAYQKGYKQVLLVGGGAKRSDHFLSNLSLMQKDIAPALWLTAYELMINITHSLELKVSKGQTLSFYGFGLPIKVESRGLQWPLNHLNWQQGYVGLSNCAVLDKVDIKVEKGNLLLLMPYKMIGDVVEWL